MGLEIPNSTGADQQYDETQTERIMPMRALGDAVQAEYTQWFARSLQKCLRRNKFRRTSYLADQRIFDMDDPSWLQSYSNQNFTQDQRISGEQRRRRNHLRCLRYVSNRYRPN